MLSLKDIKDLYKTVWELSMKDIIDMSRQRGYFIDQSTIVKLVYGRCNNGKINIDAFLRLEIRIKTGMYYLRTKSAVDAIKFTLNNDKKAEPVPVAIETQE